VSLVRLGGETSIGTISLLEKLNAQLRSRSHSYGTLGSVSLPFFLFLFLSFSFSLSLSLSPSLSLSSSSSSLPSLPFSPFKLAPSLSLPPAVPSSAAVCSHRARETAYTARLRRTRLGSTGTTFALVPPIVRRPRRCSMHDGTVHTAHVDKPTNQRTHARMHARTHACTHARTVIFTLREDVT